MYRISYIIILLIITINICYTKVPSLIYIENKSSICNDVFILSADDSKEKYNYCFYGIYCRAHVVKNYSVIDNYGLNSGVNIYSAHLISGSYQGPDFTYMLIETNSDKVVAKIYNIGEKNIIIDPLTGSYNPNNNSIDKMDEYFEYNNQNRILTLTKRLNIEIYKIIITDLMGKTIYSTNIDQNSYYIDLSNSSDGEYFLTVIAPQTYLMKKITLIK